MTSVGLFRGREDGHGVQGRCVRAFAEDPDVRESGVVLGVLQPVQLVQAFGCPVVGVEMLDGRRPGRVPVAPSP